MRSSYLHAALSRNLGLDPRSLTQDGLHPTWDCTLEALQRPGRYYECRYQHMAAALINQLTWEAWMARPTATASRPHRPLQLSTRGPCEVLPPLLLPHRGSEVGEEEQRLERCYDWEQDYETDPSHSASESRMQPRLLPQSFGWRRTEQDTATTFEPPARCMRPIAGQPSLEGCPKVRA